MEKCLTQRDVFKRDLFKIMCEITPKSQIKEADSEFLTLLDTIVQSIEAREFNKILPLDIQGTISPETGMECLAKYS